MTEIYERIIVRDNYIYTGCYHQLSPIFHSSVRHRANETDGQMRRRRACAKSVAGGETVRGRGKIERKKRLLRKFPRLSNRSRDGLNKWTEENRIIKDK